ncbi:DUF3341 domain-containing protein [Pedobacter sp. SD-b]|uniref:DUF3341 domain-containing protein n=1 Tax=Pedobacter segetis TaxID=2793069 RepID=A0ABS1BKC2_9SPHI|nr:DUF3341 domain-containing protein [Pedobacter segetis]MBK0383338.1 DUF3341 domain-containing protein [Pedobacter segetis]
MSDIKYILGLFEDPDDMMNGIDKLQDNDISVYDVYTPMPIHGIEDKLGVKRSRLDIVAFICGITGTCTGFGMIYFMLVMDWPMNVGGKPNFAIPDFIPITFELTVLFCAFGMVAAFFYRTHLFPGRAPRVMELRATTDRFVIAIDANKGFDNQKIDNLLKEAGAIEIKHNDRKYVSYE